jgi:phosphoribosyl 1,2-cyclic phosphate phosphodiesterase
VKLTCYGTGAAEAIPGIFCDCEVCEKARQLRGKEIRSRHLSTVDEDIQFDLGPDLFYHVAAFGLDPRKTRHLIITHAHSDHLMPDVLGLRRPPFSFAKAGTLQLIGNAAVLERTLQGADADFESNHIQWTEAVPFVSIPLDGQTSLTPLPANHAPEIGGGLIYLLERSGRSLLYAHDTGELPKEAFAFLAGRRLDAASLDCTGAYRGAGMHHMDLEGCQDAVLRLKKDGALKEDAKIVLNHFSHGGGATHAQLEKEASRRGWIAAFDGMALEI